MDYLPRVSRGSDRAMSIRKTAAIRRGLRWIHGRAAADFDAMLPADMNAKDRAEVVRAFEWLREQMRDARRTANESRDALGQRERYHDYSF